ncbi:hypothetical protein Chor_011620 [Crotalus horridus]
MTLSLLPPVLPIGYTGQYCEVNPDDCAGHPCLNGGTCQDGIGSYTCHCIQGWTGLLCHLPDACLSNPCHPDAHCDTDLKTGHAICTCQLGYAGARCYEDIDECRMGSNPCEHRGSCYNTPGSFTCSCLRGYTGSRCESNLNECLSQPCQNGASCLDLLDRFQCLCPSGFEGLQCERDADFCHGDPCQHGTCVNVPGSFTCVCAPGFTGPLCEEFSDPCWEFQCLHGGSCRGTESGPLCICSPGWTGQKCDTEVDACSSSPCHQRATCLSRQGAFQCVCPSGYVGAACDAEVDECASRPCLNSGTCLNSPGSFHCLCPRGYSGLKCQVTLDLCSDLLAVTKVPKWRKLYQDDRWFSMLMSARNKRCPSLAGDAHCDQICSSPETSWDGGDCALGLLDPWKNCLKRDLCQPVFRDGHCHPPCDNEECLYDGFDCAPQKECNPSYARYCWDRFSDGHCDRGCHSASCGWDGGDCASSVPPAESALALVVLLSRESVPELLRSLVVATRAELRIQRDRQQRERIYPYTGKEELGSQSNWTGLQTKDLAETVGYTVFLLVEGSSCQGQCPTSAISALNLLGSLMAKEILSSLIPHQVIRRPPSPISLGLSFIAWVLGRSCWLWRSLSGCGGSVELSIRSTDLFGSRQDLHHAKARSVVAVGGIRPTKLSTEFAEDHDTFSNPHFDESLNLKDVKILLRQRQTDLDASAEDGTTPLILATRLGVENMVEELVANHADLHAIDKRGKSALHWAAAVNNLRATLILLRNGADKDILDNQAQTPLFLAAREGSYQVASLLLQHGAKQNLRNHMGRLPKDVALERLHHDILSLLDRPCLPSGTGQLSPHRPRPQPSSKLHRWPYPPKPSQLTPVPENEGPFKDATPSEEAMGQTVE